MEEKDYYKLKGYVSSSSLKHIRNIGKFKKFIDGELEQEDTSYLSFGKLVHLHTLENNVYKDTIVPYEYVVPRSAQQKQFMEDFLNNRNSKLKIDEALIKAYKQNYTTKEKDETILKKATGLRDSFKTYEKYLKLSKTKHVIPQKDHTKIKTIDKNLKAHKKANELLFGDADFIDEGNTTSHNETAILWEYKGVKCKSLLDRVIVDKKNKKITIVDLKTTSNLDEFKSSFDKYRYDRQLAFYSSAIFHGKHLFIGEDENIEDYTLECYIVAVDTINYRVKVSKIDESILLTATKEIAELLQIADWHIKENKWDYSKEYYEGDGTEVL